MFRISHLCPTRLMPGWRGKRSHFCAARVCRWNRAVNGQQADCLKWALADELRRSARLNLAVCFACGATRAGVHWCAKGKSKDGRFADQLVEACAAMVKTWATSTGARLGCFYSLTPASELLCRDFARRLATALNLPFHSAAGKDRMTARHKNKWQTAANKRGMWMVP